MKRISVLMALLLALLTSCSSPVESPSDLNPQASGSSSAIIGHIGPQGEAVLDLSQQDLADAFISTFQLMGVDEFTIESETYGFFLEGACIVNEETKVSFGIGLVPDQDGTLLLAAGGSTQTCTSSTGCKGCKLTKVDASSGYCDCIASNVYVDPGNGKCTHSISSSTLGGSSSSAALTDLISAINS